jgi:PAS domain S-box-containing protein
VIPHLSERALILAPRGRDAALAASVLGEAQLRSVICEDEGRLLREIAAGAGVAVVTEEALLGRDLHPLARWIEEQAEWSDFPFILLTERGGGIERNPAAQRHLDLLGNVTFLERPFHPTSLVSLVRAALRGRRRQYEARARLEALRESEDHYRHTVELNPQVAWTAQPDGMLDHVARRWHDWTGTTGLGATWGDALHPDDLGPSREAWAHAVATGEPYDVEHRMRMRDGAYRWIHSRAFARRDEAGGIVKWYGTTEDIEERKRTEARLREDARVIETVSRAGAALAAELDLGRLLQSLTDAGVALTGAGFGAFFENQPDEADGSLHLFTLSGARREDFASLGGVRATGIFGPTFRNEGAVRSDDVLADPRYGQWEPHRGMPAGHLPVRSYLGISVVSREGNVLGGLLFGHPEPGRFTERHEQLMTGLAAQAAVAIDNARLFQALEAARGTLEERVAERTTALEATQAALQQAQKMEAVGQLTGGIAHDFNNLLQGVAGSLDLIRRKTDDPARVARWAEAGLEAADKGAKLTAQLLAFSRAQRIEAKPVQVSHLVEGMSELLERTLGPKLDVALDLRAREGGPVLSDPTQLEMAVLNLAINARDAMPEGGSLRIATRDHSLSADPELPPGDYVELSVADAGTGMTPEVMARAFDPFFTTKGVGKGTGLGLSQVYGIARQGGGTARVESRLGRGTTVRLLLRRTDPPAADGSSDAEAQMGPEVEGARVLVVDDDATVRRFLVESLHALGYSVAEAADGPAGLRTLEGEAPDLLLVDYAMPGMTGAEVARAAREARPLLPVIFATGYSDTAAIEQVAGPAPTVLRKPFRVEELRAAMAAALRAARA